jgi:hypothetical protein
MASGKPNKAGDALAGVARIFETTVRGSSVPASSLIAFSPQPSSGSRAVVSTLLRRAVLHEPKLIAPPHLSPPSLGDSIVSAQTSAAVHSCRCWVICTVLTVHRSLPIYPSGNRTFPVSGGMSQRRQQRNSARFGGSLFPHRVSKKRPQHRGPC